MLRRLLYGALGLVLVAGAAYAAGTLATYNGLLYSVNACCGNANIPAVTLVNIDGVPAGSTGVPIGVAPNPYPVGAVQINATSGVVANNVANATLGGAAGKNTYLSGVYIAALGATAAAVVDCTITGITGPTVFHFPLAFPAGANVQAQGVNVSFSDPLISNGVNTAITISCPAGGAGNVYTSVNATGFQL